MSFNLNQDEDQELNFNSPKAVHKANSAHQSVLQKSRSMSMSSDGDNVLKK
jgi:hypothetical protein